VYISALYAKERQATLLLLEFRPLHMELPLCSFNFNKPLSSLANMASENLKNEETPLLKKQQKMHTASTWRLTLLQGQGQQGQQVQEGFVSSEQWLGLGPLPSLNIVAAADVVLAEAAKKKEEQRKADARAVKDKRVAEAKRAKQLQAESAKAAEEERAVEAAAAAKQKKVEERLAADQQAAVQQKL
jgi:hypothetical protein